MNINPHFSYRPLEFPFPQANADPLAAFDAGFRPQRAGDEKAMTLNDLKEIVDHPEKIQSGQKLKSTLHESDEIRWIMDLQRQQRMMAEKAALQDALQFLQQADSRLSWSEKGGHAAQYDRSMQLMLLSTDIATWDSTSIDAWLHLDTTLDNWFAQLSLERPLNQAIESAFEESIYRPEKSEIALKHTELNDLGIESDDENRGKRALLLRYQAIAFDLLARTEGHRITASPEIAEFLGRLTRPTDSAVWNHLPLPQRSGLLIDASAHRALPVLNGDHQHVDLFIGRLFDQQDSEYSKGMLSALHHVLSHDPTKEISIDTLHDINTLAMGYRNPPAHPDDKRCFGLHEPNEEGIHELFSLVQVELESAVSIELCVDWDHHTNFPISSGPISKERALANLGDCPILVFASKSSADRTLIAKRLISEFWKNCPDPAFARRTEAVKLAKCLDILHLFHDGNNRAAHLLLKLLGGCGELPFLTDPNHLESRSVREIEADIDRNKAILDGFQKRKTGEVKERG